MPRLNGTCWGSNIWQNCRTSDGSFRTWSSYEDAIPGNTLNKRKHCGNYFSQVDSRRGGSSAIEINQGISVSEPLFTVLVVRLEKKEGMKPYKQSRNGHLRIFL
jgi:hypothetical protein